MGRPFLILESETVPAGMERATIGVTGLEVIVFPIPEHGARRAHYDYLPLTQHSRRPPYAQISRRDESSRLRHGAVPFRGHVGIRMPAAPAKRYWLSTEEGMGRSPRGACAHREQGQREPTGKGRTRRTGGGRSRTGHGQAREASAGERLRTVRRPCNAEPLSRAHSAAAGSVPRIFRSWARYSAPQDRVTLFCMSDRPSLRALRPIAPHKLEHVGRTTTGAE